MDSQCPGCLGQAVVTLWLPCAIVESLRCHKHVPFVNIAFQRSRLIKRRQWKYRFDYYGVVVAHLATECGIKAKDPSGLDADRWIPHSRCCENPAWAKAVPGFSRHLSAGFTDLNPARRSLSLYNWGTCVTAAWQDIFFLKSIMKILCLFPGQSKCMFRLKVYNYTHIGADTPLPWHVSDKRSMQGSSEQRERKPALRRVKYLGDPRKFR